MVTATGTTTAGAGTGVLVRIGTRQSALALAQAHMVRAALAARSGVTGELVTFTTVGDQRLDVPLAAIGGKGLFTKELETALLAGTIDCAVHSLKDLPTESPAGLAVVAVLPREDPRDVLVVGPGHAATRLSALRHGARIGTSSLRRRAQLAAARPDLEVVELRGNVPTRLRKVADGEVDAAVLAAAGLLRLELADRITAYLDAPGWLPAAGQGAIAIQIRADDVETREAIAPLNDGPTMIAVTAERAMLAALEGGCQVPIGALVVRHEGALVLHGLIADVGGRQVLRGREAVDPGRPVASGEALARHLRALGADAILAELRSSTAVPAPQPE
jgi:hydroxymethylbilane synthase